MKQPEIPLDALKLAKRLILLHADEHRLDATKDTMFGESLKKMHVNQAELAEKYRDQIEEFEIAYIISYNDG